MTAAMRETQRRKLLYAAHLRAESMLKAEAAKLLKQRFQHLKRELRRANLRKRLRKTDGVFMKAEDPRWSEWIKEFSNAFQNALKTAIGWFISIERDYFSSHGETFLNLDPNKVILDYHDRVGIRITRIAEDTLRNTQKIITDWYNTEGSLRELIDLLAPLYGEDRAELIARTEAGYARSEVAAAAMQNYGINKWIWDSVMENRTCAFCASMNGTVHDLGEDMPPDASHPDCLCGITYANDDGSELIYGG